jgi:hypothetical protein
MKHTIIVLFIALVTLINVISCNAPEPAKETLKANADSLIKRGRYLVTIAGCGDCHSPKIMTALGPVADSTKLFSGHRADAAPIEISKDAFSRGWVLFNGENTSLATPFFVSYAANITSDTTGIGMWSFQQFKTAMTKGKWKGIEGSRDLLPPMPWMNYKEMSEEDLQAIFSFLKSTKPVRNVVPVPLTVK